MSRVTRGNGLLEGCLARRRCARADALIPDELRAGRILDIGCGRYPLFLRTTAFREKVGSTVSRGRRTPASRA